MTNRTLGLFVTACLLILLIQPAMPQTAGATSVVVSMPGAEVSVGSETILPIAIRTGSKGLGALQFDLSYDPAILAPVKVEPGRLLSGLTEFNITSPGRLRVALATSEALTDEGEVLRATFRALATGQSSLRVENARAWEQATSFETTVGAESGLVTVVAPAPLDMFGGLLILGCVLLVTAVAGVLVFRRRRHTPAPTPPYLPASVTQAPPPTSPVAPPVVGPRCIACGQTLPPGSRFCASCGTFSRARQCPSCGTEHSPDARFCRNCGTSVRS